MLQQYNQIINFVVFIYWTVTKKSTKLSYSLEESCAASPEGKQSVSKEPPEILFDDSRLTDDATVVIRGLDDLRNSEFT